ncbi:uncharacterized protein METZ01_LOCUS411750 [marine metagenome]|mgnify:CR=1 FL=1|uniref:Uncharacterized protein n=1 Tax=marine metagenome TaxID=408172 RepID=A0A382WIX4_9ZZZZ
MLTFKSNCETLNPVMRDMTDMIKIGVEEIFHTDTEAQNAEQNKLDKMFEAAEAVGSTDGNEIFDFGPEC